MGVAGSSPVSCSIVTSTPPSVLLGGVVAFGASPHIGSPTDAGLAKRRLERLASSLEAEHPGAAGSIREGLDETLTLQRLGIEGALYQTLRSTNTIENLNSLIATYTRNVKRWQGGSMVLRWASAAVLDASKRFRRIRGFRDLHRLLGALKSIETEQNDATDQQVA